MEKEKAGTISSLQAALPSPLKKVFPKWPAKRIELLHSESINFTCTPIGIQEVGNNGCIMSALVDDKDVRPPLFAGRWDIFISQRISFPEVDINGVES